MKKEEPAADYVLFVANLPLRAAVAFRRGDCGCCREWTPRVRRQTLLSFLTYSTTVAIDTTRAPTYPIALSYGRNRYCI
jgi:hypothetical protein